MLLECRHGHPCASTDVRRHLREAEKNESWFSSMTSLLAAGDELEAETALRSSHSCAQALASALVTIRKEMGGADDDGAEGERLLKVAADGFRIKDMQLPSRSWHMVVLYMLSLGAVGLPGTHDTLCRVVAECFLPVPKYKVDQVRQFTDALTQAVRGGGDVVSPSSSVTDLNSEPRFSRGSRGGRGGGVSGSLGRGGGRTGTPVVGIGRGGMTHGIGAAGASDGEEDIIASRPQLTPASNVVKSTAGSRRLAHMVDDSDDSDVGGVPSLTRAAGARQQQAQPAAQTPKQQGSSPSCAAATSETGGLSAYQMRRMHAAGASGSAGNSGSSSGRGRGRGLPGRGGTPGRGSGGLSLLSRIHKDPSWAVAAGGADSDDEIADLNDF